MAKGATIGSQVARGMLQAERLKKRAARNQRALRALRRLRAQNRKYPPSKFGHQFMPAGTNVEAYGASWKDANAVQRAKRQADHYYGAGGYWSGAKKFLRRAGGSMLHAGLAAGRAELMGAIGGAGIYTGTGSYSNDLVAGGGDSIASFASAADEAGAITITHKEFLTDIYGNDAAPSGGTLPFVNQTFPLNPGLEVTFPWLSQIAQNYEEYEFRQLMFTYHSIVAEVSSTNGQVGTTIMCTNYNPSAEPFVDKNTMMTYAHAASAKTTDDMVHGVECDPSKLSGDPGKYVRAKPVVIGEDLKTYDWGTFQLAIANSPSTFSNASIGELWVAYTVVLRKPKFFTGKGLGLQRYNQVMPFTSITNLDKRSGKPFGDPTQFAQYCLFAQQNNLPCRWVPSGTINTVSTGAGGNVLLLPASYSGVLRILITMEIQISQAGSPGYDPYRIAFNPGICTGNVRPFLDAYAFTPAHVGPGGGSLAATPTYYSCQPLVAAYDGVPTYTTGAITLIMHVMVTPASNGQDNGIYWLSTNSEGIGNRITWESGVGGGPGVSIGQIMLDIQEYNSGFQTSNTIDAPIYVNSTGLVTTVA